MTAKTRTMILLILTGWLLSAVPAFPQIMGVIKGHVVDKETQAPVVKAKVIIASARTQAARSEIVTDKNGFFYKSGLPPGVYQVSCEKAGFAPSITNMRLTIAEEREVTIPLDVLKDGTKTVLSLMTRVEALLGEGRFQETIDKITEAAAGEALNYVLYYYRAVALEKAGDQPKALADYQKALELKPDFFPVLAGLGKLYARMGDNPKAVEFYKKAFESGSTDVLVLFNYGVCLINASENAQAKTIFEKLLTIDPAYPDAHYQLGIICLGLGETARAKEYLGKFVELDPENATASVAKEILKTLKLNY